MECNEDFHHQLLELLWVALSRDLLSLTLVLKSLVTYPLEFLSLVH